MTPFDTQILKFGLNGELSLTCLTCYRKKMNSKGCNSTPQWELEQFTSCTLWPGSVHMSEPVQLQCPMSQCQIPAQHQCCAVSLWPCTQDRTLSELLLPLHTWLWARGVTSLAVCCCHTHVQTDPQYLTHISVEMHLRHLGSTHVPKCSANHAAVCTAMHLCACCINSVPFR